MTTLQSYEELDSNLKEYKGQLAQVEELLLLDPENEELNDMYNSLLEVIELTTDLLKDARDQQQQQQQHAAVAAQLAGAVAPFLQVVTPPTLTLPSILPASVAEQIRRAQVRAALTGQAPVAWAIGAKCQAMYTDGEWYEAKVDSITATGHFAVVFDGYGNKEELAPSYVRPIPEANEVYRGVAAPKRKRVEEQPVVTELPKWLEIKPGDDEKTKARKRKLLKSYKSKVRFQEMDLAQKKKQDSWQTFVKGKGQKKKTGYLTDMKKDSIFKVPEGISAKVGVVNSGKQMTDYQKRSRHEFALDEQ